MHITFSNQIMNHESDEKVLNEIAISLSHFKSLKLSYALTIFYIGGVDIHNSIHKVSKVKDALKRNQYTGRLLRGNRKLTTLFSFKESTT